MPLNAGIRVDGLHIAAKDAEDVKTADLAPKGKAMCLYQLPQIKCWATFPAMAIPRREQKKSNTSFGVEDCPFTSWAEYLEFRAIAMVEL
jgi:hypothetical protein